MGAGRGGGLHSLGRRLVTTVLALYKEREVATFSLCGVSSVGWASRGEGRLVTAAPRVVAIATTIDPALRVIRLKGQMSSRMALNFT